MPKRPLRPCKQPRCPALVESGYCTKHYKPEPSLRSLPSPNTSFYKSHKWRKKSEVYREEHSLCERCYEKGLVVKAELVHHKPDLNYLFKHGLNPLDEKYLESLCFNCHQKELRRKRNG